MGIWSYLAMISRMNGLIEGHPRIEGLVEVKETIWVEIQEMDPVRAVDSLHLKGHL